jgi:ATP-binding cassette subfamily F protein 3
MPSRAPAAGPAKASPSPSSGGGGADERKARAQARQRLSDTTRPLRNEISQIDKRLEKLGQERTAAETALSSSSTQPADMADLGRALNHIAAETAMLEERWLELQEQIETLQAQAQ